MEKILVITGCDIREGRASILTSQKSCKVFLPLDGEQHVRIFGANAVFRILYDSVMCLERLVSEAGAKWL
jgi:hypothetical protein